MVMMVLVNKCTAQCAYQDWLQGLLTLVLYANYKKKNLNTISQ